MLKYRDKKEYLGLCKNKSNVDASFGLKMRRSLSTLQHILSKFGLDIYKGNRTSKQKPKRNSQAWWITLNRSNKSPKGFYKRRTF